MNEEVEKALVEGRSLQEGTIGTRQAQDDDGEKQIGNEKTNRHNDDQKSEKSPENGHNRHLNYYRETMSLTDACRKSGQKNKKQNTKNRKG